MGWLITYEPYYIGVTHMGKLTILNRCTSLIPYRLWLLFRLPSNLVGACLREFAQYHEKVRKKMKKFSKKMKKKQFFEGNVNFPEFIANLVSLNISIDVEIIATGGTTHWDIRFTLKIEYPVALGPRVLGSVGQVSASVRPTISDQTCWLSNTESNESKLNWSCLSCFFSELSKIL